MSELIQNNSTLNTVRKHLLAGVSAIAIGTLFAHATLAAEDDKPTVWVDVGTQLERLSDAQESFEPAFVSALLENPFTPPGQVQSPPRFAFGQEGRITFTPHDSDWVFSAGIRYGRANKARNVHEETSRTAVKAIISIPAFSYYSVYSQAPLSHRFATTHAETKSVDLLVDFQAGKDVGLGVFGTHGASTFNMGVRFAQFTSHSSARIDSDPDFAVSYKYLTNIFGRPANVKIPQQSWDVYTARMDMRRSFSGVGPSLAWTGDAEVAGNGNRTSFTVDWGVNGALLFGRQKVKGHHETTAHFRSKSHHTSYPVPTAYPPKSHNVERSRSVVVPNIGGFAGMSLRFPNAKLSLGYRVDAFFGAMDGGIDARKTYDRDFYGPFATISIGLGG